MMMKIAKKMTAMTFGSRAAVLAAVLVAGNQLTVIVRTQFCPLPLRRGGTAPLWRAQTQNTKHLVELKHNRKHLGELKHKIENT